MVHLLDGRVQDGMFRLSKSASPRAGIRGSGFPEPESIQQKSALTTPFGHVGSVALQGAFAADADSM
jgi:hypothetical protein